MVRTIAILLLTASLIQACSSTKKATSTTTSASTPSSPPPTPTSTQAGPKTEREFRAAWVATVANINWPSKPGLPVDSQQKEAIAMLDFLKANHFNAVIFQVRPQADALYKSNLEPWSYYLTGTQGKAPEPFYDPLQFWVEAAHDRGIELHVWLNPYRAHHPTGGPVSDQSLVKRMPESVVYLKEGYWWFDPTMKSTQDHSAAVVMDLVKRYDIDGVHFDDYFYPYPAYNKNEDFPDSTSWKAYTAGGGTLSKGDWRRKGVNDFIERLYREIKAEKKHVKFGLSPFGIWRPGFPEMACCFDQYDVLYADAKLWLNKGWIDYFSPQLYWAINRPQQSFPALLNWWAKENTMQRHLWPGISVGNDTSSKNVTEIMNQIWITRGLVPESKGIIHWSIGQVFKNPPMAKGLLDGPYKKQALVPTSNWLDNQAPAIPEATQEKLNDSTYTIRWSHAKEKDIFHYVVYYQHGNTWNYQVLNRNDRSFQLPAAITVNKQQVPLKAVAVTAVDRLGNESNKRTITLTR
jgi:uncharacterized lipoprotein YddW (UPF0748 family)